MKKREAIALTLKDGTRVRKSKWIKKVFIYYCSKDEKILWYDGEPFVDINFDFEQAGWEIYREVVVASGVIELFQKHTEIQRQTGKHKLRWQSDFGVISTHSDFADKGVFARYDGLAVYVDWESEKVGKTFTLLDDSSPKKASHET